MCDKFDEKIMVDRAAVIQAVRDVLMEEFGWVSLDGARFDASLGESLGGRVFDLLEIPESQPDCETTR